MSKTTPGLVMGLFGGLSVSCTMFGIHRLAPILAMMVIAAVSTVGAALAAYIHKQRESKFLDPLTIGTLQGLVTFGVLIVLYLRH